MVDAWQASGCAALSPRLRETPGQADQLVLRCDHRSEADPDAPKGTSSLRQIRTRQRSPPCGIMTDARLLSGAAARASTGRMNETFGSLVPTVVVAAALAFWIYALRDLIRTDEREVRVFERPVWLVIVLFDSVVGAAAWWMLGRPTAAQR